MKYCLLLLTILIFSCSQLPTSRTDKLSILQGITNTKEVEFSILALKGRNLRFELRDENGEIIAPDETKIVSRDFSPYVVHKTVFVRDPQKDYNFYAFDGASIVDQRLVGRGQKSPSHLRIAVASCMNDFLDKHFAIWGTLAAQNPEYVLMIGDNVYADVSSLTTTHEVDPETLWNRYVDARLRIPFYFQQKLIPTHALWDDHDYGQNNAGSDFKYKEESKAVFEAFFAQDMSDDDWSKGFGVGGLLTLGDFNLYFLDARTFRSKDPKGTQLGLDQTAWFYSKLREEAAPSFVIMGDQFFGGYHQFESFERDHPENFNQFVNELKQINTPFIFMSGDRHMSEIMQFPRSLFGKPSFEITSSPIHSKTFGKEVEKEKNPWRVVAERENVNFMLIDNDAKDNHWFLDVQNIGENGNLYFKRELAVYIKDLQDNLKEARKRRYGKRRYRKMRSKRR